MKKVLLLPFFIPLFCLSQALQTQSIDLKPIHHQGLYYYYDFKRVDGGAYGLQIPLQSLNDAEINARYKNFKAIRNVEAVISFIPLIYVLTVLPDHHRHTQSELWTVLGATVGGVIILDILAKHQLKKGIDRYNRLILQPGSRAPGLSLTYMF